MEFIDYDNCQHENIFNDSCVDCGLTIYSITNDCYTGNETNVRTERTILEDLKNFNIPASVKTTANAVYQKLGFDITRNNKRKQVIFFCVFEAHHINGLTKDPIWLCNLMGYNKDIIKKAFSVCSPSQTGYEAKCSIINPCDLLGFYMEQLRMDYIYYEEIKSMINRIIEKDDNLLDETPQVLCGAMIYYYMICNGFNVNMSEISKATNHSENIIKILYDQIVKIDNC